LGIDRNIEIYLIFNAVRLNLFQSFINSIKSTPSWIFQPKSDPYVKINNRIVNWPQNEGFAVQLNKTMWGELKKRVHKHGPLNLNDLERFCMEE